MTILLYNFHMSFRMGVGDDKNVSESGLRSYFKSDNTYIEK